MRSIIVLAAAATFAGGVFAQAAQSDQDHAAHHPAGASAAAPATKGAAKPSTKVAPKPAGTASAPSSMQMDTMMKSMKDMHDKMMAAKTPEERQALMDEHMKTMKDRMGMMGQMKGGQPAMAMRGKDGMPCQDEMMSKRMDMMEMMMQMMMDRDAARSTPAK